MTSFSNILKKAKRRMAAARAIHITGRALVIAILIATVVLAVDRLMNLNLPVVVYIVITSSGVVIGVLAALLRRVDNFSVAVRLDRKLNLRDRLGTAEAIRIGDIVNAEFGELITRDAERVSENLDVKSATPIKLTRDWPTAGVLAILLGAAIAFVPSLERSSNGQTPVEIAELQEQLHQQQQQIVKTIEDAVADIDDELLDDEIREDLEALEKLAEQLSDDAGSADTLADARNQSAAELDAIAQRLEEQSQRNSQTIDSIAERFAGMEQAQAPMKSQEFEEALRNGKFEDAAKILDALKREAEQMSQDERDKVAEHFRNMSEHISNDDSTTMDENADPVREAMHDLGIGDEEVDEILNEENSEDEIADALEQQGVDKDVARELAEDTKQAQQQQEMQQQVDEQARELADALDEAADEINKNQSDTKTEKEGDSQEQSQSKQSQDGSQKRQTESDEPSQNTDTSNENNKQQSLEQKEDDQGQSGEGEQREERVTSDPDKPQQDDEQSIKKQSSNEENPNAKNNPSKRLGEALRKLAEKQREAAKGKSSSKQLREAARKIADSLSDEEKRELAQKWMSEFNKPSDNANPLPNASNNPQDITGSEADSIAQAANENLQPDIEDVDLTENKPGDKSIFEWLSDQPVTGDSQKTTQSKQVVRKAQSAAEHAVGDSTVPKRYHDLIKRYFGKLNDTVEKATKQTDNNTKVKITKPTTEDDS